MEILNSKYQKLLPSKQLGPETNASTLERAPLRHTYRIESLVADTTLSSCNPIYRLIACVILSLSLTYEHKRYVIVTSLQTSHKLKIHFFFCFKFTIEVYFHKYSNSILFQKATIKKILSLFTQSHCSVQLLVSKRIINYTAIFMDIQSRP